MLQMMTGGMPTREYVIGKGQAATGATGYVAYWRDSTDMASFGQRAICADETATGLMALMARHYPGATCVYLPEDVASIVAEAIRATDETDTTRIDVSVARRTDDE
jgi:hypothetical protein